MPHFVGFRRLTRRTVQIYYAERYVLKLLQGVLLAILIRSSTGRATEQTSAFCPGTEFAIWSGAGGLFRVKSDCGGW